MDGFYVGAYWGARKETIHACADRLTQFLTALSACDAMLAVWYKLGKSRRQAKQVEIDFRSKACLVDLLERGRNRKDVGKEIIDELGFHIGLWNGGKSHNDAGLSITCGLYSTAPGLGGNCVVIDLPEELGDLRQSERMTKVLVAVAECWEPNWAGVISRKSRETRNFEPGKVFVDWMVYVSRRIDRVPSPSSVVQLEKGSLIVVRPEPPAVNATEAQESIRKIENILR